MRFLAPLRNPIMARLWGALSIFTTGDELYRVALVWLAVGLVGRESGYLGAVQSGCMLAGAVFGGRFAGAVSPRHAMSALLAAGAVAAVIPAIAWDSGNPSFAALIVAAAGISLMRAQLEPAVQGHLPLLVPDRDLLFAANGLIDGVRRMARITGPMLAAAMALIMPVHELFYAYSIALLFAAYLLLRVGAALPPREGRSDGGFMLGVRIVLGEKTLRRLLILKSCTDGCWVVVIAHGLPLIVDQRAATWLGLSGVGAYGTGLAAYGTANILGSVIVGSLRPSVSAPRMLGGVTLMCAGLVVMGCAATFADDAALLPALYLALAFAALGSPFFDVPLALRIQLAGGPKAPRSAPSSVHRVRIVAAFAGIMLAGLVSPSLFGAIGTGPAMIAAASLALVASLATLALVARDPATA